MGSYISEEEERSLEITDKLLEASGSFAYIGKTTTILWAVTYLERRKEV